MTPKLYMTEICPCVRAVLLTARVLEVTLELIEVDISNKENLSTKFLKLNPQHTVPTLQENGFVIWDSHAIIAYLVGKYGKDDSLYPKDVEARALVDQRLHFESAVVSCFMRKIMDPVLHGKGKINSNEHESCIRETYNLVETFLENRIWVAGNNLTIADLSLIPSITSLDILVPIDAQKYPRITKWIHQAESLPFYVANENGLNKLKSLICCHKQEVLID